MAKLKTSENFCLKILYFLDKKSHFKKFMNQSMINNLNNKHRLGAAFRCSFFLLSAPSPMLVIYSTRRKK